jgi:SAM-dependent methyltransferase
MLAELLARSGKTLLQHTPPDGRKYWAGRFWDRHTAEQHPLLREDFLAQKDTVSGYLKKYGQDAEQVLEFACGTGDFTLMALEQTGTPKLTALDISAEGLEIVRGRTDHPGLRLVFGDFWADNQLGTAGLVMCLDAIHHLGDVRQVLERMRSFVAPGGVLVGNLWTGDHFHDFERQRYGTLRHLVRTVGFFSTATLIRLSGGRLKTGSYRTQLINSWEAAAILREVFGEVLEVKVDRYFMAFVVKP